MKLQLSTEFCSDNVSIYRPDSHEPTSLCAPHWLTSDVLAAAGPASPSALHVLPIAIERVRAIAPWLTVAAAPILLMRVTDEGYEASQYVEIREVGKDCKSKLSRINGVSIGAEELICLSFFNRGWDLLSTTYHELWHAVEEKIDSKLLFDIDREMTNFDFGSAYLNVPWERRARAFEVWCMRFQEGMPTIQIQSVTDDVFNYVATGAFASEWKQQSKSSRSLIATPKRSSITSRLISALRALPRSSTMPPTRG